MNTSFLIAPSISLVRATAPIGILPRENTDGTQVLLFCTNEFARILALSLRIEVN